MSQERDCNTCDSHVQGDADLFSVGSPCWTCINQPSALPNWKGITISKSYDAAFREDNTLPPTIFPTPRRVVVGQPYKPFGGKKESSDGSTAGYYTLPQGATELQDLISHKDMNAQMGEIFRAVYRFGEVAHSPKIRDIKKIIFYAQEELKRLEKLEG